MDRPTLLPALLARLAPIALLAQAIAPSAAAYYVRTVTAADGDTQDGVGCEASYNGSGNPSEGALFLLHGGVEPPCPASPFAATDGSLVTYSGTIDPLGQEIGRATRSTDDSAILGATYGATGSATADIAGATVEAVADSTLHSQSNAIAYFSDGLAFQIPGADANTVTPVGVHLELHGSITDPVKADGSAATGEWDVHFQNASVLVGLEEDRLGQFVPQILYASPSGWASAAFSQSTVSDVVFDGEYDLIGAGPSFDVRELLQLYCRFGSSCDYGTPTVLRLTLPPGVSYTSTSGVFLTTAPEPAGFAQGLAGAVVLALVDRTRRRGNPQRTRGRG